MKLSIIVTTFNVARYIGKCLDDCLNQTFKDFELIVVDDGSTDNTQSIINSYALKDNRIRPILMTENSPGGVATAANIGLNAAKGEWIGFADGDDLFDPTMFEKLLSVAEDNQVDFSICKFKEYDTNEGLAYDPWDPYWDSFPKYSVVNLKDPNTKTLFLKLNPVPWRKLYKRSFLEENYIRFNECNFFFEDNSFHWFITLNATSVAFVDEPLCYHRMNRKGQTMQVGGSRLLGVFHQFNVIYDYLNSTDQYQYFKTSLISWFFTQTSWVAEVLTKNFSQDLYNILKEKLSYFTLSEVKPILRQNFGKKLTAIVLAVYDDDYRMFERALNNDFHFSPKDRLSIKYYQLGFKGLLKSSTKKLVSKIKQKRIHKNDRLATLHWEVSEIRKLLELSVEYNQHLLNELHKRNDEQK